MEEQKRKNIAKVCFILMIVFIVIAVILLFVPFISAIMGHSVGFPLGEFLLDLLAAMILGGVSHRLVDKNGAKWEKVAYVLTFPAFIISFVFLALIFAIINRSKSNANSNQTDKPNDNVFIYYENRRIELYFIDTSIYYGQNGSIDSNNPYYGKHYLRYGEVSTTGAGPFWMSFDGGKTFVREDAFDPYTYKG